MVKKNIENIFNELDKANINPFTEKFLFRLNKYLSLCGKATNSNLQEKIHNFLNNMYFFLKNLQNNDLLSQQAGNVINRGIYLETEILISRYIEDRHSTANFSISKLSIGKNEHSLSWLLSGFSEVNSNYYKNLKKLYEYRNNLAHSPNIENIIGPTELFIGILKYFLSVIILLY